MKRITSGVEFFWEWVYNTSVIHPFSSLPPNFPLLKAKTLGSQTITFNFRWNSIEKFLDRLVDDIRVILWSGFDAFGMYFSSIVPSFCLFFDLMWMCGLCPFGININIHYVGSAIVQWKPRITSTNSHFHFHLHFQTLRSFWGTRNGQRYDAGMIKTFCKSPPNGPRHPAAQTYNSSKHINTSFTRFPHLRLPKGI